MLTDQAFYWPPADTGAGIFRARCPFDECAYVGYFLTPPRQEVTGIVEDTIVGAVMMYLYRQHPAHYCTRCARWHSTEPRCVVHS